MDDFTTLIENTLINHAPVDDVEREKAASDGESGSILVEWKDGRKFRVSYEPIH